MYHVPQRAEWAVDYALVQCKELKESLAAHLATALTGQDVCGGWRHRCRGRRCQVGCDKRAAASGVSGLFLNAGTRYSGISGMRTLAVLFLALFARNNTASGLWPAGQAICPVLGCPLSSWYCALVWWMVHRPRWSRHRARPKGLEIRGPLDPLGRGYWMPGMSGLRVAACALFRVTVVMATETRNKSESPPTDPA